MVTGKKGLLALFSKSRYNKNMTGERYFTVINDAWRLETGPAHHCTQAFLGFSSQKEKDPSSPPCVAVNFYSAPLKISYANAPSSFEESKNSYHTAALTVKSSENAARETEMIIEDMETARNLASFHVGRVLEKTVFTFPSLKDIDLEVNVFHGELSGLVVAVISETDDVRLLPQWVGDEIVLSDHLLCTSPKDLISQQAATPPHWRPPGI